MTSLCSNATARVFLAQQRTHGRRGEEEAAQFRQAHFLQPAAIPILDLRLPDVTQALIRAGCITFDGLMQMPPAIADRTPREGEVQIGVVNQTLRF
jgi:hypothetical protein